MARYTGPKEKIERRLKAKLFLKGERSLSPKSATVKRMYPPGVHGKKISGRPSEFSGQLQAKQRVKKTYRMMERQFKNWAKEAIGGREETGASLIKKLEFRLDNTIYRGGLAQSRDQARQIVSHGHIVVNDRKVSIPSYQVKVGDEIAFREGSKKTKLFSALLPQWIKKQQPPSWIKIDQEKLTLKISGVPNFVESGLNHSDIQSLVEYYSR
jgi:small subunit ribosomal protein S4